MLSILYQLTHKLTIDTDILWKYTRRIQQKSLETGTMLTYFCNRFSGSLLYTQIDIIMSEIPKQLGGNALQKGEFTGINVVFPDFFLMCKPYPKGRCCSFITKECFVPRDSLNDSEETKHNRLQMLQGIFLRIHHSCRWYIFC